MRQHSKRRNTSNLTTAYIDAEMWHYGPYKLVPLSGGRVALPGMQILGVETLSAMAAMRGWRLLKPAVVHQ